MRLARIYFHVSSSSFRLPAMEHSKTTLAMPQGKITSAKVKKIELYGRLHADLFNFDNMLINGVGLDIKLTRALKLPIFWHLQTIPSCISKF